MNKEWQNRFDRAFKEWADRPPKMTSRDAAERVVEQAESETFAPWFRSAYPRIAAAAAALILVLVVSWSVTLRPSPAPQPESEIAVPPLEDHVVLLWLDQDTPLYLTVAAPATEGDL